MEIKTLLEKAKKELASLTGFTSPAAIGIAKTDNEWVATIEIVEKQSIPEGMDILGIYEIHLNEDGDFLSYKRKELRKRTDTGASAEE